MFSLKHECWRWFCPCRGSALVRIKTHDQHEAFATAWFAKLEMRGDLIGSKRSLEYIKDLGASMK